MKPIKKAAPPAADKWVLSKEDGETVRVAYSRVTQLHAKLGEVCETYKLQEAQIIGALDKAKKELQTVVSTVGKKNGVPVGDQKRQVRFDTATMTFTRVGH